MKKFLTAFIALMCAIVCAFALFACDATGNGGSGNNGESNSKDDTKTVAVTSVKLNKNELTLNVGDSEMLTATVTPDNATNKTVTWSVEPKGIVTVEGGSVYAVSEGTARITASAGGKSDSCLVKVNRVVQSGTVTAEQWVQTFENLTNFTVAKSGQSSLMKIAGDRQANGSTIIYTKEGDNYYYYYYRDGWTKDGPRDIYKTVFEIQAKWLSIFKDSYSSFTYSNGKYLCATVIINSYVYNDIEVTFENDQLTGIIYEIENGMYAGHYTAFDIGSTTVDLPEDYVAATHG